MRNGHCHNYTFLYRQKHDRCLFFSGMVCHEYIYGGTRQGPLFPFESTYLHAYEVVVVDWSMYDEMDSGHLSTDIHMPCRGFSFDLNNVPVSETPWHGYESDRKRRIFNFLGKDWLQVFTYWRERAEDPIVYITLPLPLWSVRTRTNIRNHNIYSLGFILYSNINCSTAQSRNLKFRTESEEQLTHPSSVILVMLPKYKCQSRSLVNAQIPSHPQNTKTILCWHLQ